MACNDTGDPVNLQRRPPPAPALRANVETHLVVEVDVHVLAEGVPLGEARGAVLHQVEGLEGPEGGQQLLHLQHTAKNDATLQTAHLTEAPESSQPEEAAIYSEEGGGGSRLNRLGATERRRSLMQKYQPGHRSGNSANRR